MARDRKSRGIPQVCVRVLCVIQLVVEGGAHAHPPKIGVRLITVAKCESLVTTTQKAGALIM